MHNALVSFGFKVGLFTQSKTWCVKLPQTSSPASLVDYLHCTTEKKTLG